MNSRHHDGFTLVELIISIGLGLIIVYTAFAGFRAASQTVTVANRLSIENAMLRAGVVAAPDELDFWRAYDEPGIRIPLRAGAPGTGLPFAPFKNTWPQSNSGNPEEDRGYEPEPDAWEGPGAGGLRVLEPVTALAWFNFPADVTRFRFTN